MTLTERRLLLKRLIKSGYQVSPDALDYILSLETPSSVVDAIIEVSTSIEGPNVLSRDYIVKLLEGPESKESVQEIPSPTEPVVEKKSHRLQVQPESVSDIKDWAITILKNPQLDSVGSAGTVEDFLALFHDRFQRIKQIYLSRIDTQTAISPSAAKATSGAARRRRAMGREAQRSRRPPSQKVIGITKTKNISRSRNVILEIEDTEDSIIVVVPTGIEGLRGQNLSEKANAIMLDEVVCISGYVDEDGRMIADDVIFPDIPTARDVGRAKRDVYAVFISDLHCGSSEFLEDEFDYFIDWLRGRQSMDTPKAVVEQVRYLFIAGDLVDGIGVYPEQRSDLAIPDIFDQYALLSAKLRSLPDRIKIICIPGNHDACRQALPKPQISDEFAQSLHALNEKILMLGDPAHIVVEGVNVLITHGDSLDDLVTNIPGASYKEPALPMKSLLQKRHLAPLYGNKTELAPLHRDWMVIDTPPDIVHFGHAHHNAVDNYRGVQIINSGTFQAQTDFMRKQGVVPTPGIVTLLNL
ncbi:MAG: metallophosphoesterase, partial [Candidatus Hodarchaeota archaeon]